MATPLEPQAQDRTQLLKEKRIPQTQVTPQYGEIMLASDESNGGLVSIPESRGKRVLALSGGTKKLFVFEEENDSENVVTALHPQQDDYAEHGGRQVQPIDEIVVALEGNKIGEIRSGRQHSIVLTCEGSVYAFGKGNFGALGLGGTVFSSGPRLISKLAAKRIISIACGCQHSLALSDIGDVFSWGRGFEGQLGLLQGVESSSVPQYIPHFFKYDNRKEVRMLKKIPIHAIACGAYHSIAIDHQQQVYCWGQALYGQTGSGRKKKQPVPAKIELGPVRMVKAAGGFGHTLCLTDDGELYTWGLNIKGQLGLNDLPEHMKAEGESEITYISAAYSPRRLDVSRDKTPLPKFKDIACGFSSSYAIDEDGQAWAWGGGNLGFKDKFLERGPVALTQSTQKRRFSKVFANDNSLLLFCPLSLLFFKPALVPSNGGTQLTFFGNGFVETENQAVRFRVEEDKVEVPLSYDEKTGTYYCRAPNFEKVNKLLGFPLECEVEVTLDGKEYFKYDRPLMVYSSKTQIQSIEPNCGSVLGGSQARLFMPIHSSLLSYIDNITVGFKNTNLVGQNEGQKSGEGQNLDWICTEGSYNNETITCNIPNIPDYDQQNPFYMLDVSLNGQQFTELPHTFRYYLISDASISPNQTENQEEIQCTLNGNGLFDTPHKELRITLSFSHEQQNYSSTRTADLTWSKQEKNFSFTMPTLSWLIGDHQITPELLQNARKQPPIVQLFLSGGEGVEVGRFTFLTPPPPPEPEEDKKDNKKDSKKTGKK